MDIALTLTSPDGLNTQIDLAIAGGDLKTDAGLKTAVMVSLFSDRTANADDQIPSGDGDRRGWWGDAVDDPIGSRLWLLDRAGATDKNARLAEHYAEEALQWLIDDGIAAGVSAAASWIAAGALKLVISVWRKSKIGPPDHRFDLAWSATP